MEKPPLTYPHTLLSSVRHRASRRAPGLHGPDLAHAFSLISRLRLQDNVLHEHKSFPFFVRAFLCTPLRITDPTGRYAARRSPLCPYMHHHIHPDHHPYTIVTIELHPPSTGVTLIGTRFSPEKRNARPDINR